MAIRRRKKKGNDFYLIGKVEVRYFRSLYKATIKNPCDLNLIFGRNDSGKSNFLRALNLFFNDTIDLSTDLDFEIDFSDMRRQEAKDAKGKQFISVRIDFNVPENFRNSLGSSVSIKRQWNIHGEMNETPPRNLSTGARIQLTKFLNQIDYTYIPAIKDVSVFGDLIQRMYDAAAASPGLQKGAQGFIESIRSETTSLSKKLSSTLGVQTSLAAPTEMGLLFRTMDFALGDDRHSLLLQKGDGIKARHIPELLRYINENESNKKFFVWGFEEPENSLDIASAVLEAENFASIASRSDTQVFISSHSPAFYLAEGSEGQSCDVRRYFVSKQEKEKSIVSPTEAFSEIDTVEAAETKMESASFTQLPFLIRKLAEKQNQIKVLERQYEQIKDEFDSGKPLVFVEGESDQIILQKVVDVFFPKHSNKVIFRTKPSGGGENYVLDMMSAWRNHHKHHPDRPKAAAILDCDALNDLGEFAPARKWNSGPGNVKSAKIFQLPTPKQLIPTIKCGYKLPIALESYYPISVWDDAKKRGWLEEADTSNRVPEAVLKKAMTTESTIDELLPSDAAIFISKKYKSTKKIKQAKQIERKPEENLLHLLGEFRPVVKDVLQYLDLEVDKNED